MARSVLEGLVLKHVARQWTSPPPPSAQASKSVKATPTKSATSKRHSASHHR